MSGAAGRGMRGGAGWRCVGDGARGRIPVSGRRDRVARWALPAVRRGGAGTVAGNGVGRGGAEAGLPRRSRDGDRVHAVIRGQRINNDGADKVGFTAPSVHGQAAVVSAALAAAGVEADVDRLRRGARHGDDARRSDRGGGAAAGVRGRTRAGDVRARIGEGERRAPGCGGGRDGSRSRRCWRPGRCRRASHFKHAEPTTRPRTVLRADDGVAVADTRRRPGARASARSGWAAPTRTSSWKKRRPVRRAMLGRRVAGGAGQWTDARTRVVTAATQLADSLGASRYGALADVAYTQQVGRAALAVRRVAVGRDSCGRWRRRLRTRTGSHGRRRGRRWCGCFRGRARRCWDGGGAVRYGAGRSARSWTRARPCVAPLLGGDLRAVLYRGPDADRGGAR